MSRGILIAAAFGLVVAGTAPSTPAESTVLTCDGLVHLRDRALGIAACTNPTDETWQFRAVVVCGRALDVRGDWVTLPPGAYGTSQGRCGGTVIGGVGGVDVEERRV